MKTWQLLIAAALFGAVTLADAEPGDETGEKTTTETAEPTDADAAESTPASIPGSAPAGPLDSETSTDDTEGEADETAESDTDDAGLFGDDDIEVRGPGRSFEPSEEISADSAVSFPADI